jgi:hypothetical protein
MDTRKILSELRAERDRIDQAIAALEALNTSGPETAARTSSTRTNPGRATQGAAKPGPKSRGPRHMSPAARKRISEMMKKRWAERRKAKA